MLFQAVRTSLRSSCEAKRLQEARPRPVRAGRGLRLRSIPTALLPSTLPQPEHEEAFAASVSSKLTPFALNHPDRFNTWAPPPERSLPAGPWRLMASVSLMSSLQHRLSRSGFLCLRRRLEIALPGLVSASSSSHCPVSVKVTEVESPISGSLPRRQELPVTAHVGQSKHSATRVSSWGPVCVCEWVSACVCEWVSARVCVCSA